MVRFIGIAVLILGLIVQPLRAAVPDSMPVSDASSSMSMDHSRPDGAHGTMSPCHEMAAEQAAPMSCPDCDDDCAGGSCASACSPGTLALLPPTLFNVDSFTAVQVAVAGDAPVQGLPSRIFHPPKHA
ncbi:MAG: hypothetical protein KDI33_08880 [Halioglobus sp.]|nr:hypothetical protein [Halioglobus sp.]